MSDLNPHGPIYVGDDGHIGIAQHAMNGAGAVADGFPPRVVLTLPGVSVVLTADGADRAAAALTTTATTARASAATSPGPVGAPMIPCPDCDGMGAHVYSLAVDNECHTCHGACEIPAPRTTPA